MTGMAVMPRESDDWTVDDLVNLPDDGLQYELLDGILVITPPPGPVHQAVIGEFFALLNVACPEHLAVFAAPLEWQPDIHTSMQPDLLVVARDDDIGERNVSQPLMLAVEVLSPSTHRKDRVLKFSKYADADVASYWIIDPAIPAVLAYDLVEGAYVVAGRAQGSESVQLARPFPIMITPAELIDA
jgi:Uma2 family endonuclease